MSKVKSGYKSGKWTVIEKDNSKKNYFICKCECGTIRSVTYSTLIGRPNASCGCDKKERISKANKTHLESKTRLYNIWQHIKKRCYNKKSNSYHDYGERGIIVCNEWLDSFENFKDWAINNDYEENLTIERINTNGNYEPSNCTWILKKDQAKNRRVRKSKIFNSERQSKSIKQMAKEAGIPISTFRRKLIKERNFNVN